MHLRFYLQLSAKELYDIMPGTEDVALRYVSKSRDRRHASVSLDASHPAALTTVS